MKKITFTFLLFISPLLLLAQENNSLKAKAESLHKTLSKKVNVYSKKLDAFFSDQKAFEEENQSQLFIYFNNTLKPKNNNQPDYHFNMNIRSKLILPRTQKKLQLILEDTREHIANNIFLTKEPQLSPSFNPKTTPKNHPQTALRFKNLQKEHLKISTDLGLRFKKVPQLLGRVRLKSTQSFNAGPLEEVIKIYWYEDEGWAYAAHVFFTHNLDPKTKIEFSEQVNGFFNRLPFYQDQYLTFFHQPSSDKQYAFQVFLNEDHSPKWRLKNTGSAFIYKKNILNQWLFLHTRLSLDFPREKQWKGQPALLIFLEAVFS